MFSLSDESESKPDTHTVDSLAPLKIIRYQTRSSVGESINQFIDEFKTTLTKQHLSFLTRPVVVSYIYSLLQNLELDVGIQTQLFIKICQLMFAHVSLKFHIPDFVDARLLMKCHLIHRLHLNSSISSSLEIFSIGYDCWTMISSEKDPVLGQRQFSLYKTQLSFITKYSRDNAA